jgi:hypothetical protein
VCKNNPRIDFKLSLANTLTNGKPYYYKYGFRYKNTEERKMVIFNNKKLKELKTTELKIEDLNNIIKKNSEIKYINIDEIQNEINETLKLYEKYKDKLIVKFLYNIKYNYCVIFGLIYFDIFKNLGLMEYKNKSMY